jgi:MFS family permease
VPVSGVEEQVPVVRDGPLRQAAFRWFAGGRLVSLLGNAMAPVALAFAVLQAAGNDRDLGVVLAAESIPMVLFLLLGGAVADRFSRSTVLLVSHVGAGLTQGAVAVLLLTDRYALVPVAALAAANGTLQAFTGPALTGIVPQLVGPAVLQRANALLGTSRNAARILGPSVAGVLVATVGGGWAIAFDALTWLVAAACLSRVRLPRPVPGGSSVLGDVRAGWGEFRSRTWVWVVVAVFSVMNALYVGVWGVLGPVIAEDTFGAGAWGIVLSANAVGLLVVTLVMYRVSTVHLLRAGQLGIAAGGLEMLLLGLGAPVPLLVAAAFVAGLGAGLFGIAWDTSLQEHVPVHALSRVASYDALGSFVATPVGQLTVVPVALALGSTRVAVVSGVLYGVLALAALASRSVRDLRHVR